MNTIQLTKIMKSHPSSKKLYLGTLGSPKDYGIDGYMKKHALSTVYNKQVLQTKLSVYCGLYCLLFLICKCKHRSLKYFLNLFDKPKINDNTFFRLINKYL